MADATHFARLHRLSIAQCAGHAPIVPGPSRLEVDVGFGKGRFLLSRASTRRDVAFLGIERQVGRVERVARKVEAAGLQNVRLLKLEAYYVIGNLLPPSSVDGYYVFFPDPWPKRRHHVRRLFDPDFLDSAWRTLKPGGFIHAATDDAAYFTQISGSLSRDSRFAPVEPFIPTEDERTDFELIFAAQGRKALRCSVRRLP